jgi:alpha-ketoglutarate-dependent taurine dioxygenase
MELVTGDIYDASRGFPLVIRPLSGASRVEALIEWFGAERERVDRELQRYGALLFRGFGLDSHENFCRFRDACVERSMDYVDGNSPRTKLPNRIYTTTEYPADQEISMHNELSYSTSWPERLYLCCVTPPATGGETPIADGRRIVRALRPETAEAFEKSRVRYIRNLHDGIGIGPSWQDTFETSDHSEVEAFCRRGEIEFHWKDDGGLWLSQLGHGITRHPQTGEKVWFNQVDQFHPTNLPPEVCEYLLFEYEGREHELPLYSCFEDGTPIPHDVYDEIRRVNREESVYAPWERGDLAVVDNMLMLHGRNSFTGERRVLIALA